MYATYMSVLGNREDLFGDSPYVDKYITNPPADYDVNPEYLNDEKFATLITEAEVSARDFHSVFPPVVSKNVSYNKKGAPRLLRGAPIGYHSLSCLTSDEIGMVFHNKSL